MSKKEKLIKELIDLIGEDKFTDKDKEELKSLSEEDLELIISLRKSLDETLPDIDELLDESTNDEEERGSFEIIPMPSFEELFGGGLKITHPNQTIADKNKNNVKPRLHKVMSPSEMVKELDKTVIGHPDAKKHLAVVMFKHLMERNNQMKLKEMGKEMTKSNVWITGNSGCVDCDTEYFNGNRWVRISDYKEGDNVLIYNANGKATLEKPIKYIKEPCNTMTLMTTKNGKVNQCLSDDHRMIYFTKKTDVPHEINFKEFKEDIYKDNKEKLIKTSFDYEGKGIDLTDDEIRVMVMTIADATFNKDSNTNRAVVHVKKDRKSIRAKELLEKANIKYSYNYNNNTKYHTIGYLAPRKEKHFTEYWYNCNKHQMEVVLDEIMYWDGRVDKKGRKEFCTTIKESADFIQFIACCLGKYSTISACDRRGRVRNINGKEYATKSIDYTVRICKSKSKISVSHSIVKPIFEDYKTLDGYKYCFSVSSGMLILRRNNRVFVTGNCGKTHMVTTLCKILNLDYVLVDCASITAEGYIGNNWSEEIGRIYDVCEGDEDRINKSIVILDELDKLKNNNSEGNRVDVGGGEATKALLKILEGTQLKVGKGFGMTKYIDTSNIMFIATGTFNNGEPSIEDIVRERLDKKGHKREIGFFGESAFKKEVIHDVNEIRRNISHEDMIKYGMSVEMIGRFGDIINLDILTKEDYIKIAKLEKGGFEEYKTLFELYGKTLTVKEDVYELLAERMLNSQVNARSLKSLCDKVMVELVYEMVDNNRKKKYVVTREMVEESLGFKKEQEELKAENA